MIAVQQLALAFDDSPCDNSQATTCPTTAVEDAPQTARGVGGASSASLPMLSIAYRLHDGTAVYESLPPTSDGQGHNVPSVAIDHWLFPLPHERSVWERQECAR